MRRSLDLQHMKVKQYCNEYFRVKYQGIEIYSNAWNLLTLQQRKLEILSFSDKHVLAW